MGYTRQEAENAMRHAVELAADAIRASPASGKAKIALSLGAYGATLSPSQEYSGNYPVTMSTERALRDWHAERLDVFKSEPDTWEEVQYVAFETIRIPTEILTIRQSAKDIGKKWWVSCVVPEVINYEEVKELARSMVQPFEQKYERPWGIGVNCTAVRKIGTIMNIFTKALVENLQDPQDKMWLIFYPDGTDSEIYDTQKMEWVETDESRYDGQ